jgi:hypothetical protein
MAFAKHCARNATSVVSDQGADRSDRLARVAWQAPDIAAVDAAQGRDSQRCRTSETRPAGGAEGGGVGMAQCREDRRQKGQGGPGAGCAHQISPAVCGAGDQAAVPPDTPRPASASEMDPGAQSRRQASIARNHQGQSPRATDAGDIAAKHCPAGLRVVAQHHPGQTTRQASDRWTGVGQPACVREQPKAGQFRSSPA